MSSLRQQREGWVNSMVHRGVLRNVIIATAIVALLSTVALFTASYVGPKLASLIPGGSIEVAGRQLTAKQKDRALAVLMSDQGVKQLLQRGALIPQDRILSLEVTVSRINSDTGEIEQATEVWAEAQMELGNQEYRAQVDLEAGKVVSISGLSLDGSTLHGCFPTMEIPVA